MSRDPDFHPMWGELVAGTRLEDIKNEEYWRWVEPISSSLIQAESAGVSPKSEMTQEALNLGRFCFYIRMKIDTFPFFLCLHWWEYHSGDCPEGLFSPCYFTATLQPCCPGQHHPGQNGMEEGWLFELPVPEVGTGATVQGFGGLLLFPVFGGGLAWITARTALHIFQSQDPESVDTVLQQQAVSA